MTDHSKLNKKNYPALDVVRTLAMLAVVFSHYRAALFPAYIELASKGMLAKGLYTTSRWGHAAVIVFFCLSGFLVGGKVCADVKNGDFDFGRFYIRRLTRIMIPLWGAIVVFAVAAYALRVPVSIKEMLYNAVGVGHPNPLLGAWWALFVELRFYISIGLIGWALSSRSMVVKILSLVFAVSITAWLFQGCWHWLLIFAIATFMPVAMQKLSLKNFHVKVIVPVSICAVLIGLLLSSFISNNELSDLFIGGIFLWLIGALTNIDISPKSISFRIVSHLSRFSYSTYLTHMIFLVVLCNVVFTAPATCAMVDMRYFNICTYAKPMNMFMNVDAASMFWFALAVLSSLTFSYGFYWVFERPTSKLSTLITRLSRRKYVV